MTIDENIPISEFEYNGKNIPIAILGTVVDINGEKQETISFTDQPQKQIDTANANINKLSTSLNELTNVVKTNTDKVYASWYEWKSPALYDRMLVISNLSRKNKSVKLQLDLKKLGLDGKRLSYYDLWTGKTLQNIDILEVGANNFRLIGIKAIR